MARNNLADLTAFLAVANERSFTRAAARLGVSQSALSHAIRGLEERLGLRLSRTTRSVAPTEAGERLVRSVGPRLEEVSGGLERTQGQTIRHDPHHGRRTRGRSDPVAGAGAAAAAYPDIKVELIIDYGLTDIVAERYDAGVRLGEQVAKGMIAVRIGPDFPMAVVGAPSYFATRGKPKNPQELTAHDCINIRLPTYGGLYAWEFEKRGRAVKVRVEGQLVFNNFGLRMNAVLAGLGLACLPEDQVREHVARGRLVHVLADWCPPFSGYHLYYPSRRQAGSVLALLVEALRYRGSSR